jgi:hypothetical protein
VFAPATWRAAQPLGELAKFAGDAVHLDVEGLGIVAVLTKPVDAVRKLIRDRGVVAHGASPM